MADDAYAEVIRVLSSAKRVLITTHVRPDGDALGSTAAMQLALKSRGIESTILLLSHLPRKYSFIFLEHGINYFDVEKGWDQFSLDGFDALLVCDTGTWSQLPGLEERLKGWTRPKVVIDHHLTQQDWADVKLVDTAAGACGEIVEELLGKWGVKIDHSIAMALFVAIVTDTGWFQYSNTRPRTLRLAADLMEVGVDTDHIQQLLYRSERAERVALHARGLQSLELLADGRVAVLTIRKSDFERTKSSVNDTEDLINYPLQIKAVEAAALITEPIDQGPVRVSFRSKGQVDVAKFAEQFGGGGHARAAGAKFETSLAEAHDKVVAALLKASAGLK